MYKHPVRIAITDDHPLVINGLQTMIARHQHIQLLGSYGDGDAMLQGLEDNTPDVLLLDIHLPGKTGDQLVPIVLRRHPQLRIIVLTNTNSALYINNMLKLGVHGYLLKSADEQVIIRAIEEVYAGNIFIEDALQRKMELLQEKVAKSVFTRVTLTPREKDILQHIARGETNQEIAGSLYLSSRTVENYRLNLQLKLGVKNTAMLVKTAMEMGLLDIG